MDTFEVNLYIETTIKGPAIRSAAGMYVLEFIKKNGEPETRNEVIYHERTRENELVLELIISAFKRLQKPCSVLVNTECQHVLNVLNNMWLPHWEKAGWINAKGKEVAHKELWQQYLQLQEPHLVNITDEQHSYKEIYMAEMLRKEMEREHTESVERRKDV